MELWEETKNQLFGEIRKWHNEKFSSKHKYYP